MHISKTEDDKSVEAESVTKPGTEETRKAIDVLNNFSVFRKLWKSDNEIPKRNNL